LKHKAFPDHFAYRRKDVLSLVEEAKSLGADFMVTTEKDSVRIPMVNRPEVPIYVLKIDLKVTSGEEMLFDKIEGMI
jgi:tetraacyldisaccharide 4'-kinase